MPRAGWQSLMVTPPGVSFASRAPKRLGRAITDPPPSTSGRGSRLTLQPDSLALAVERGNEVGMLSQHYLALDLKRWCDFARLGREVVGQ